MRFAAGGIFVLLIAQAASAQTSTPVTPVPRVAGLISVTATSRPLLAAADTQTLLDLKARGYVEEEFFISGTANVYAWGPTGGVTGRSCGVRYTTRILLRRPRDMACYS